MIDAALGGLFGFAVLHPLSMILVDVAHNQAIQVENYLGNLLDPMGFYFALIGVSVGLLTGLFRAKLKMQNTLLKTRQDELERTIGEKDSLLRILSHDLANSIQTSSAFLAIFIKEKSGQAGTRACRHLEIIEDSLGQATELIDFARTFLAIGSGRIEIPVERFEVASLVRESIMLFEQRAREKNITMRLACDRPNCFAILEPITFKNTVFGNILSNAVKFSLKNEVIAIEIKHVPPACIVSVTNVGECIPQERQDNLFSPGLKKISVGTAGEKGTGFGLALARKFIEMMGGKIAVKITGVERKQEACSVTFSIWLPAAG